MRIVLSFGKGDLAYGTEAAEVLRARGEEVFCAVEPEGPAEIAGWLEELGEQVGACELFLLLVGGTPVEGWQLLAVELALRRRAREARGARPEGEGLRVVSVLGSRKSERLLPDFLRGGRVARLDQIAAAPDSMSEPGAGRTRGERSPFPGLAPYGEDRAPVFFGRQREIDTLVARVGAGRTRWLQVQGPAGSGKSSLVRAGLLPRLRFQPCGDAGSGYRTAAAVRPGREVLPNLARALVEATDRPDAPLRMGEVLDLLRRPDAGGLEELAARLAAGGRHAPRHLLLFIDRFEELLTLDSGELHRDVHRGHVDRLLAAAVLGEAPLTLITAMREDFAGGVMTRRLPEVGRALELAGTRFRLRAPEPVRLKEALLALAASRPPFSAFGRVELAEGLAERLMEDAPAGQGALPLVAHGLRALWDLSKGAGGDAVRLTLEGYEALGDLDGLLARDAEAALERLGDEAEREAARRHLLSMVAAGRGVPDARRPHVAGEGDAVLERLAESRLVVRNASGDHELAHEVLLERWGTLARWVDLDRRLLEARDDLEPAALGPGAPRELPALESAEQEARLEALLSPEARQELEKARRAREVERRRRSGLALLGVAGFGLLVALVALAAALFVPEADEHPAVAPAPQRPGSEEEKYRVALEAFAALAEAAPRDVLKQSDLSVTHERLGNLAQARGDLETAQHHYEAARDIVARLAEMEPERSEWRWDLAASHGRLARLALARGRPGEALERFGAAIELLSALAESEPANPAWKRDLASTHDEVGELLLAQGERAAAARHFGLAAGERRKLAAADPMNAEWKRDLSISHEHLGDMALDDGDVAAARPHFEADLAIARSLAAEAPGDTGRQRDLAVSYLRMADLLAAEGVATEAVREKLEAARERCGAPGEGLCLEVEAGLARLGGR